MKKGLLTIALITMFTLSLPAQEKLTFDEMFRWFPAGKYEGITFKDNHAARTMPGFKILKDVDINLSRWHKEVMIPATLKEHWLNMTQMQSVKVVVSVGKDSPKSARGGRTMSFLMGEEYYCANSFGYRMQVINFSPDLDLLRLALAQEGVTQEKETLGDYPLFFADIENPNNRTLDFHFCITPENQILASNNKEMLEKMVAAGTDLAPSVTNDFPFPQVRDHFDEFGQYWKLMYWGSMLQAIFNKAEKDEVDNSHLDRVRRNLDYQPPRVYTDHFSHEPVSKTWNFYSDPKLAENDFSYWKKHEGKRRPNITQPESSWLRDTKSKYTLNGSIFLETLTYDSAIAAKMKELVAEERKEYEELEAKRKAAKAKKKGEK